MRPVRAWTARQRLEQARPGLERGRRGSEQEQRRGELERGEQRDRSPPRCARRPRSSVESAAGMPVRRCTASRAISRVNDPSIAKVSHNVIRPNRSRPRLSSWPSCAMALDGASTPVARAIATGNARKTVHGVDVPFPDSGAVPIGVRVQEPQRDHRQRHRHERHGHRREDAAAQVPEPGDARHHAAEGQRDEDPIRGQARHVGDDRARGGRHADARSSARSPRSAPRAAGRPSPPRRRRPWPRRRRPPRGTGGSAGRSSAGRAR